MQIANSWDEVTIGKVKRSALIALGGFLLVAIPALLPGITDALKAHPQLALFIGALGTWVVNTLREWMRGQQTE